MALAKTFIITGGNTGLGCECAYALSKDNSVLAIIACRDVQKGG
jgi:NAD(P)-dependent dehydrogenase (short-subunit alcohol dehydrogenase family)